MQRSELLINDVEIINQVAEVWGFMALRINYIEFGSTFAFSLEDKHGEKVFLKIYRKDGYVIKNYFNNSIDFLRNNCDIIYRLHTMHHMQQIPVVIKTNADDYLYEYNDLIFILSHYLEGKHPSYEPNDLRARELALILNDLHSVPISEFPDVMYDNFNIDVALGLETWLEFPGKPEGHLIPMLQKISENKEFLKQAIAVLKQLQKRFVNYKTELVLTHGDAHHFNVLQNQSN